MVAAAALSRRPDATSAIARRRQLRELVDGAVEPNRGEPGNHDDRADTTNFPSGRAAEAAERLRRMSIARSGQSLSR